MSLSSAKTSVLVSWSSLSGPPLRTAASSALVGKSPGGAPLPSQLSRLTRAAPLAFKNAYRLAGLELGADELPDHLSVVLEFAATADPEAGRRLLLDHRAGIELLRLGLEDASSPYVDVVRAVTSTLPPLAGPDREAVVRLAAAGPPAEQVGLQPFAPSAYMPDLQGIR